MKDVKRAEKDILVDMRERLNGYIIPLNHDFGLNNYKYVMNNMSEYKVKTNSSFLFLSWYGSPSF